MAQLPNLTADMVESAPDLDTEPGFGTTPSAMPDFGSVQLASSPAPVPAPEPDPPVDLDAELRGLGEPLRRGRTPAPAPVAQPPAPQQPLSNTARELEQDGTIDGLVQDYQRQREDGDRRALDESRGRGWVADFAEGERTWGRRFESLWGGVQSMLASRRAALDAAGHPDAFAGVQAWLERKVEGNIGDSRRRQTEAGEIEAGTRAGPTTTLGRNLANRVGHGAIDGVVANTIKGLAYGARYIANDPDRPLSRASESGIYRVGQVISDWAKRTFPDDPARQHEFSAALAEGFGSMAGFMGPSVAVQILTRGGPMTIAMISGGLGAASQAGNITDDAVTAMRAGRTVDGQPITEASVRRAFELALPGGASEAIPIARLFQGRQGAWVSRILAQSIEEGGQEWGQQVLENIVARANYDDQRQWDDNAWQGLAIGGILGAGMQGGMEGWNRGGGGNQRHAPPTPGQQPPIVEARANVRTQPGTPAQPAPPAAAPVQPGAPAPTQVQPQPPLDPLERFGPPVGVPPPEQPVEQLPVQPQAEPTPEPYTAPAPSLAQPAPIPEQQPEAEIDPDFERFFENNRAGLIAGIEEFFDQSGLQSDLTVEDTIDVARIMAEDNVPAEEALRIFDQERLDQETGSLGRPDPSTVGSVTEPAAQAAAPLSQRLAQLQQADQAVQEPNLEARVTARIEEARAAAQEFYSQNGNAAVPSEATTQAAAQHIDRGLTLTEALERHGIEGYEAERVQRGAPESIAAPGQSRSGASPGQPGNSPSGATRGGPGAGQPTGTAAGPAGGIAAGARPGSQGTALVGRTGEQPGAAGSPGRAGMDQRGVRATQRDPARSVGLRTQFRQMLVDAVPQRLWQEQLAASPEEMEALISDALEQGLLWTDRKGTLRRTPEAERAPRPVEVVTADSLVTTPADRVNALIRQYKPVSDQVRAFAEDIDATRGLPEFDAVWKAVLDAKLSKDDAIDLAYLVGIPPKRHIAGIPVKRWTRAQALASIVQRHEDHKAYLASRAEMVQRQEIAEAVAVELMAIAADKVIETVRDEGFALFSISSQRSGNEDKPDISAADQSVSPTPPLALTEREAAAREVMSTPEWKAAAEKPPKELDTSKQEGYGSPEWRAARQYLDRDGSALAGFDRAVQYLTGIAESEVPGRYAARDRVGFIVIGYPGAGKSTAAAMLRDTYLAAHVSAGDAKQIIPEYDQGQNSGGVQEESGDLAAAMMVALAASGKNMVLETVGTSSGVAKRTQFLRENGYRVALIFQDMPKAIAMERAVARYQAEGRAIPVRLYDSLHADAVYATARQQGTIDEAAQIRWNEASQSWQLAEHSAGLGDLGRAVQELVGRRSGDALSRGPTGDAAPQPGRRPPALEPHQLDRNGFPKKPGRDRYLFSTSAQRSFTSALQRNLPEFGARVKAQLEQMLPADIAVILHDRLLDDKYVLDGRYNILLRAVEVALDGGERRAEVKGFHEIGHALREYGRDPNGIAGWLFTDKEWATLLDRASRVGIDAKITMRDLDGNTVSALPAYRERYRLALTRNGFQGDIEARIEELMNQERVNRLAEEWASGTDFGTRVNSLLERIVKFFEAIRNALNGLGFRTADDVFQAMTSGAIARRAGIGLRSNVSDEAVRSARQPLSPYEIAVRSPEGRAVLRGMGLAAIKAFHGSAGAGGGWIAGPLKSVIDRIRAKIKEARFPGEPSVLGPYGPETPMINVLRARDVTPRGEALRKIYTDLLQSEQRIDAAKAQLVAKNMTRGANDKRRALMAELDQEANRVSELIQQAQEHIATDRHHTRIGLNHMKTGAEVGEAANFNHRLGVVKGDKPDDPQAAVSVRPPIPSLDDALGAIKAYHGSPHDFDRFDISRIDEAGLMRDGWGLNFFRGTRSGDLSNYTGSNGRVYEVELSVSDDDLLRIGQPISRQSRKVQDAWASWRRPIDETIVDPVFNEGMAQRYLALGIKGQTSGEVVVIFDDTLVKIVAKDGKPVSEQERADTIAQMHQEQEGGEDSLASISSEGAAAPRAFDVGSGFSGNVTEEIKPDGSGRIRTYAVKPDTTGAATDQAQLHTAVVSEQPDGTWEVIHLDFAPGQESRLASHVTAIARDVAPAVLSPTGYLTTDAYTYWVARDPLKVMWHVNGGEVFSGLWVSPRAAEFGVNLGKPDTTGSAQTDAQLHTALAKEGFDTNRVLYRGTATAGQLGNSLTPASYGSTAVGVYLTPSHSYAETFARNGAAPGETHTPQVSGFFARINNPFVWDQRNWAETRQRITAVYPKWKVDGSTEEKFGSLTSAPGFTEALKRRGYDAVEVIGDGGFVPAGEVLEVVVLDTSNIRPVPRGGGASPVKSGTPAMSGLQNILSRMPPEAFARDRLIEKFTDRGEDGSLASISSSLDMSPEARKARAEAMGFTRRGFRTVPRAVHSDRYRINADGDNAFGLGISIAERQPFAESFHPAGPSSTREVLFRAQHPFVWDNRQWPEVESRLAAIYPDADVNEHGFLPDDYEGWTEALRAAGYDSVQVIREDASQNEWLALDPSDIRDADAAFDPAEDGSPVLLASISGPPKSKADREVRPLTEIIADLKQALGMPVTQGRYGATVVSGDTRRHFPPLAGVGGQYDSRAGVARIAISTDIGAIARQGGFHLLRVFSDTIQPFLDAHAEELGVRPAHDNPLPALNPNEGFSGLELDADTQQVLIDAAANMHQWRLWSANSGRPSPKRVKTLSVRRPDPEFAEIRRRAATALNTLERRLGRTIADALLYDLIGGPGAGGVGLGRSAFRRPDSVFGQYIEPAAVPGYVAMRYSANGTPQPRQVAGPSQMEINNGFATFFQRFITDPDGVANELPGAYAAFADFLDANSPRMLGDIDSVQLTVISNDYKQYLSATAAERLTADMGSTRDQTSWEQIKDFYQTRDQTERVNQWLSTYSYNVTDKTNPALKMKQALNAIMFENGVRDSDGRPVTLQLSEDPAYQFRMFPQAFKIGHEMLVNGVTNYGDLTASGPNLHQAITEAVGGTKRFQWTDEGIDRFGAYVTAQTGIVYWALYARQKKQPQAAEWAAIVNQYYNSPAVAQMLADGVDAPTFQSEPHAMSFAEFWKTIQDFESANSNYRRASQMAREWQHRLLTVKWQAGLLSDKMYLAYSKRREFYAPFNRKFDPEEGAFAPPGATSGGFFSGFKQLGGSQRSVINPIASMARDAYATAEIVQRNDMVRTFAELSDRAGPGAGAIVERIQKEETLAANERSFEKITETLVARGWDPIDAHSIAMQLEGDMGDAELHILYNPQHTGPKRPVTLPFFEGGERKLVRFNDIENGRRLLAAMNQLGRGMSGTLLNVVAAPAAVLRSGVIMHPAYMLGNVAGDMQMNYMLTGAPMGITHLRGAYHELSSYPKMRRLMQAFGIKPSDVAQMQDRLGLIGGGQLTASIAERAGNRRNLELRDLRNKGYQVVDIRAVGGTGSAVLGGVAGGLFGTAAGPVIGAASGGALGIAGGAAVGGALAERAVRRLRGDQDITSLENDIRQTQREMKALDRKAQDFAARMAALQATRSSQRQALEKMKAADRTLTTRLARGVGKVVGGAVGGATGAVGGLVAAPAVGPVVGATLGISAGAMVGRLMFGIGAEAAFVKTSEFLETIGRRGTAEYATKRALTYDPGLPLIDAMREGVFTANDALPFDRGGFLMGAVMRMVPFFNGNVQGIGALHRQAWAVEGDRGRLVTMPVVQGGLLGAVVGAVGGAMVGGPAGVIMGAGALTGATAGRWALGRGDISAAKLWLRYMLSRRNQGQGLTEFEKSYSKRDEIRMRRGLRVWVILSIIGVMGGALSFMNGGGDSPEEYDNVNRHTKNTHWVYKIYGMWIRMKRFEFGLPAIITEAVMDLVRKGDPRIATRIRDGIVATHVPPIIPQIATDVAAARTGIDLRTGRPITPYYLQDQSPHMRYNSFTSEFARAWAQQLHALGIPASPVAIDYALTSQLGYWGREGQILSNFLYGRTRGSTNPTDWPIIGQIINRFAFDPSRRTESHEAFFELMGRSAGPYRFAANDYNRLLRDGAPAEAVRTFLASLPHEERVYAVLQRHFSRQERNLHPLNRADQIVRINHRMMAEIIGQGLINTERGERGSVINIAPAQRREVNSILLRLEAAELWNALRDMRHPGWQGRGAIDPGPILRELQASSPSVYNEMLHRRRSNKIDGNENSPAPVGNYETDRAEWIAAERRVNEMINERNMAGLRSAWDRTFRRRRGPAYRMQDDNAVPAP